MRMRYVRKYESFREMPLNEGKISDMARSMFRKGVLPVLIVVALAKIFGKEKAIETVADMVENSRSADAFAKEIAQARKNSKDKCKKFDNYEWLAKQIDKIQVIIGDGEVGTIANYKSDNLEKLDPVIVINSKQGLEQLVADMGKGELANSYVVSTLTHEFMHFVDDLLKKGGFWSNENKSLLLSLLDKHPTKEKIADRISLFEYGESIDVIRDYYPDKAYSIENSADYVMSKMEYLRNPSEIFVRIQGLRRILFEVGITKDVNSEITEKDLSDFMVYMTRNNNADARKRAIIDGDVIELLSIIDWDSLVGNINKVAKAGKDAPTDVT